MTGGNARGAARSRLARATRRAGRSSGLTATLRIALLTALSLPLASVTLAQVGAGADLGGLSLQGPAPVPVQPAQRSVPTVSRVELGGIERVDAAAVRKKVRLVAGTTLNPAIISGDIERIFAMGLFDDVRVGVQPDKDKPGQVVVRFEMLERPSIAKISVEGNDEQSDEEVLKVVDLRANDLYSPSQAQQNVNKIKELYIEEGFFLAAVDLRVENLPGNQVHVIFDIDERTEIKVRQIDILGNEKVSDEDIKNVLRTKEGSALGFLGKDGNFKREQLDYDVQVIQYLYLTKGFIQAKVSEPEVSLSRDMRFIRISIRVHEGPEFKVGKVSISGDSVVPVDKLLPKIQLKQGDVFNYAHVQTDAQLLSNAQKEHGYAFATVSNESLPAAGERVVDWTYHVQRGKKVYFGPIQMIGASSTRDKVIRRELLFAEGELYSEVKIRQSQARVQRLGFFEKVEIKTQPTSNPQVVKALVEVKERTTGTFQVGAGFSSADNFITTAQVSKDNFLGRGQRLSLQASLSAIRTMFQGSFYEPYFMDTDVTFSLELYSYQQLYTDFTRNSTGGSLSWGYRLTPTLHAALAYNLEQVNTEIGGLSGRSDVPIASLFDSGLTSSARATITFDDRDDRFMPTQGWYLSGTAEYATEYLGSQNLFNRYTGVIRRYFPMPLEGVLKFNLVGGIILAPEGRQVPLFERFFMGGIYNVRGYQRNTLGPTIGVPTSGDPGSSLSPFNIGGNKQLYLNNELEVPLVKAPVNLRGLVFFDIGNAFGEGESLSMDALRMSFGWGVRWFSPVGPLRFEWGVPIDPKPGEDPLVFAFTIGNSF